MSQIEAILDKHNISVRSVNTLSGGDINDVYKIDTKEQSYVIKLNSAAKYPDMFKKEAQSLLLLSNTKSFEIPKVFAHGVFEDKTYLIMTYLPSGKNADFEEEFALALAKMHQYQSDLYGLDFNNFIGRLPQNNLPKTENAIDFYIHLRMEPQFELAHQNGFTFENIDRFYKNLEQIIPDEKASLIHGDLWSGNYLVTQSGRPAIYDPALAYACREMDLAMMRLFGGYPQAIFEIYNEVFPLENNWRERIELWQLYYILVHVNLFGGSYYARAKSMLSKYSI